MSESEVDRCEFWINANRIIRESGKENHELARIPVNTNWNLKLLKRWLNEYEDKKVLQYLEYGWPLNAKNTSIDESVPPNQKGARENPAQI